MSSRKDVSAPPAFIVQFSCCEEVDGHPRTAPVSTVLGTPFFSTDVAAFTAGRWHRRREAPSRLGAPGGPPSRNGERTHSGGRGDEGHEPTDDRDEARHPQERAVGTSVDACRPPRFVGRSSRLGDERSFRPGQVLVDQRDDHRPLTRGRRDSLDRAVADVARGEDAGRSSRAA